MAGLTQYLTATSLDGYIATEDNDLSWLFQFEGEDPLNPYPEFIARVGVMVMGATTYEWVLDHEKGRWPYEQPTWVFTHRDLPQPTGADVRLTSADVAEVHAEMTEVAGHRNVWLVGGGDLVGQFLDRDLLDEVWFTYVPVLLGAGAPLLPRRHTRPLRLLELRNTAGGPFVHAHYSLR